MRTLHEVQRQPNNAKILEDQSTNPDPYLTCHARDDESPILVSHQCSLGQRCAGNGHTIFTIALLLVMIQRRRQSRHDGTVLRLRRVDLGAEELLWLMINPKRAVRLALPLSHIQEHGF
jgi:hypothetical protein